MSDEAPREIVIIRRRGGLDADGHKGGAWKIAFADFMTAMMAFFLVMWLISANEKTKASIAHYFNPVKLADTTVQKKGLHETKEIEPAPPSDGKDSKKSTPPPAVEGKAPDGKVQEAKSPETKLEESKGTETKTQEAKSHESKTQEGKNKDSKKSDMKSQEGGAFAKKPTYAEIALFQDPYSVLSEIAGQPAASEGRNPSLSGPGDNGSPGGDPFRDPFAPSARELSKPVAASAPVEPAPRRTRPARVLGAGNNSDALVAAPSSNEAKPAPANNEAKPEPAINEAKKAMKPAAEAAADASEAAGQPDQQANQSEASALRASLTKAVKDAALTQGAPKIAVQRTDEGVLISLTDDIDFAMFASASAQPERKVIDVMDKIAEILKTQPGSLVVRGYTDGRPFKSASYDNWRLSTARAQMAYYMLRHGGLDEKRFERIEGYADHHLKIPGNPEAAENRRIEILLREDKP
jgi:chemotaxis protein MotB